MCGVLGDKDVEGIVGELRNSFDAWVIVGLQGARALAPEALAARVHGVGVDVEAVAADVVAGCRAAEALAQPGDRIVVFGSFLTVGPALALLATRRLALALYFAPVERKVKERLVGAAVLMAAAVILIPEMLSGPDRESQAERPRAVPQRRADQDLHDRSEPVAERAADAGRRRRSRAAAGRACAPATQPANSARGATRWQRSGKA